MSPVEPLKIAGLILVPFAAGIVPFLVGKKRFPVQPDVEKLNLLTLKDVRNAFLVSTAAMLTMGPILAFGVHQAAKAFLAANRSSLCGADACLFPDIYATLPMLWLFCLYLILPSELVSRLFYCGAKGDGLRNYADLQAGMNQRQAAKWSVAIALSVTGILMALLAPSRVQISKPESTILFKNIWPLSAVTKPVSEIQSVGRYVFPEKAMEKGEKPRPRKFFSVRFQDGYCWQSDILFESDPEELDAFLGELNKISGVAPLEAASPDMCGAK